MKGKDLAKLLLDSYADHEVVVQEYTGCNHTIMPVSEFIEAKKGEAIESWDGSGDTQIFNLKNGVTKKDVVLLKF